MHSNMVLDHLFGNIIHNIRSQILSNDANRQTWTKLSRMISKWQEINWLHFKGQFTNANAYYVPTICLYKRVMMALDLDINLIYPICCSRSLLPTMQWFDDLNVLSTCTSTSFVTLPLKHYNPFCYSRHGLQSTKSPQPNKKQIRESVVKRAIESDQNRLQSDILSIIDQKFEKADLTNFIRYDTEIKNYFIISTKPFEIDDTHPETYQYSGNYISSIKWL